MTKDTTPRPSVLSVGDTDLEMKRKTLSFFSSLLAIRGRGYYGLSNGDLPCVTSTSHLHTSVRLVPMQTVSMTTDFRQNKYT